MSKLDEILPKHRLRLMDLVEAAGVDVSDWANCKGGAARAAANPKYCYEWSFVEPGSCRLQLVVQALTSAATIDELLKKHGIQK